MCFRAAFFGEKSRADETLFGQRRRGAHIRQRGISGAQSLSRTVGGKGEPRKCAGFWSPLVYAANALNVLFGAAVVSPCEIVLASDWGEKINMTSKVKRLGWMLPGMLSN